MNARAPLFAVGMAVVAMSMVAPLTAEAGSVLDDYLALPGELLPEVLRDPEVRARSIVLKDLRNGYLGIEWDGDRHAVALFVRRDKSRLLALASEGTHCDSPLWFFTLRDGRWVDVTEEMLAPVKLTSLVKTVNKRHLEEAGLSSEGAEVCGGCWLVYELPRHGTTILIKDALHLTQKMGGLLTVAEMRWNRTSFELHPLPDLGVGQAAKP